MFDKLLPYVLVILKRVRDAGEAFNPFMLK